MLVWIRFDGLPRKCMHILGGQSLTRQRSYRLHSFPPFLESCVSRRSLMKKIHIVFQSEISENDDKDREPHSRQILQFQNFPARIRRTCRLANPFLNLLVRAKDLNDSAPCFIIFPGVSDKGIPSVALILIVPSCNWIPE